MSDGNTDLWKVDFEFESRPSWDYIWTEFARSISNRSCDPKHKVGAVIVTADNTQVLAIGYNGDEKGGTNKRASMQTGRSGFIHAELNALIKCDFNFPKDKKLYVTLSPCIMCAKAIINADIKHVIYINKYDNEGINLLKNYGIITTQYPK